jgi:Ser/Thr protein kinase RdoA (MazF antagonist)
MTNVGSEDDWQRDTVTTRSGRVIPVRGTSRRPNWDELPRGVRDEIARLAGSDVVRATSTGTGFTSGFASRLDLADGRSVFVKAASARTDQRVGWKITGAYREEIRKLRALPREVPAPRLQWWLDGDVDGERWVVLALEAINGRPPRRPWQRDELALVCEALAAMAPAVAVVPEELHLEPFQSEFVGIDGWVDRVVERDGASPWLDEVTALAHESLERCSGSALAHLDLRDDNILIDTADKVWICDWNWPLVGAPWLDLVTLLISVYGDGLDADAVLATHPLTAEVEPRSIDAWLATLWLYFTTTKEQPVPAHSPHIRDHQAWYDDAVRVWLSSRLTRDVPPPHRRRHVTSGFVPATPASGLDAGSDES